MIRVFRAEGDKLNRLILTANSLDDATQQTGHGVYASFRTYEGVRAFRVERQLTRMRTSAELLGQPFPLSNDYLRSMARRAIEQAQLDPARVRVTVPHAEPEVAIITVEPFTPPSPEMLRDGVAVGLVPAARQVARAKDSRWIDDRSQMWAGQGEVYEVMLHDDDGHILEGLSSNFYAVYQGRLHTADEGVLEGIARSVLLEVAPQVLPVERSPITLAQLPEVEAAMLTSSSRGVIPIVRVGRAVIGGPAPVVYALQGAYDAHIEAEMEPL